MENINKFMKNYDAGKILDIASGQGNFIYFLVESKSYEKIIATDNIAQYKQAFVNNFTDKNIEFQTADAYNLPFPDESFDTVSLSNSLHHFEFLDKLFLEIKRVLKKNGHVIFNEMYSDNLTKAQISHRDLHHISAEQDRLLNKFHNDTYPKEELLKTYNSLGFVQIFLEDYAFPTPDPFQKETLEYIFKTIDYLKQNCSNNPKLSSIIPKLDNLRTYVKENGYASTSSLFYVGQKK